MIKPKYGIGDVIAFKKDGITYQREVYGLKTEYVSSLLEESYKVFYEVIIETGVHCIIPERSVINVEEEKDTLNTKYQRGQEVNFTATGIIKAVEIRKLKEHRKIFYHIEVEDKNFIIAEENIWI